MGKGRRGEEMIRIDDERGEMWCSSSILSFLELGWEREARRVAALRAISSERARIRRAPLIRAAFRGLVKSDAGTLRKEVPASLSPWPPGRLG